MVSRRIKLFFLLTVFILSIVVTSFFIIKMSMKNHNLKSLADNYDISIESVDDKENSLKPEIIFRAIDKKELNQSIDIKVKVNDNGSKENPIELYYQPEYNSKLFEYIFLKNIIKTFPQWKNNNFSFSYDSLKQAAWVKYSNEQNDNYLNWFFKITSKI